MLDWTIWATFLAVGNATALLAIYLICRMRIEQTRSRLSVLEREAVLARTSEQANEKKLARIFDAVVELRETNETQLNHLRARIDELLNQDMARGNRSAA